MVTRPPLSARVALRLVTRIFQGQGITRALVRLKSLALADDAERRRRGGESS